MGSRRVLTCTSILVCALTVGCGSVPGSPIAPSPEADTPAPTPPIPPTAPVPSPTVASVVIDDAFAIGGPSWTCGTDGCKPGPGYLYEVRFLVRETGGRSGATIKEAYVSNLNYKPGVTSRQGSSESCWRDEQWVAPGGTLDVFYTDEGSRWLGYCYIGIDGPPGLTSLELEIFFVDDQRKHGSARATISRFR